MKLAQLFSIYPEYQVGEVALEEVHGITQKSSDVDAGIVFVAVRGRNQDGHSFIGDSINKNALALIVEDRTVVPDDYRGAVVVVDSTRQAMQALASRFYGNPAEKMFCVGVTGTNGKTSTCYMIECVLSKFGWPTGVMGTIDHHFEGQTWKSELTTPDAITLNKRLAEMRALDAKAVAFEVSSHALDQHRADGIPLDAAVFTNLSRDHLDYHLDMENYFNAKQLLFSKVLYDSGKKIRTAIFNHDDPYSRRIEVPAQVRRLTFGQTDADLTFRILEMDFGGSMVEINWQQKMSTFFCPLPGVMNVYNAAAALGVGLAAGSSMLSASQALTEFTGVPGRLQKVINSQGLHVFVDYAHTDDALRSVLVSLNRIRAQTGSENKIICVFGCGGDRDRGKRPLMMKAALETADTVFVTSDNPRREDPQKIIDEILVEVPNSALEKNVFREVDRKRAIERALQFAGKNDVVLIAGKGHESYQILADKTIEFSDLQIAKSILGA